MEKKPTTKRTTKPKTAGAAKKVVERKRRPKKPVVVQQEQPVVVQPKPTPRLTYLYAVGRRKTAVARVRLHKKGDGAITVNGKPLHEYFPTERWQATVRQPLNVAGVTPGSISVKVRGGGQNSQAESVRHGIARVILLLDPAARIPLKRAGLLTRDARVKERKKYGLKRARRAPQWQKR